MLTTTRGLEVSAMSKGMRKSIRSIVESRYILLIMGCIVQYI